MGNKKQNNAGKIGDNYLSLKHESMTRVKLVLGNGFDLACGLKSSYASFFESMDEVHKGIELWIEDKSNALPDKASVWDLIFVLLKKEYKPFENPEAVNWKDVESVIRLALGFSCQNFEPITCNLDNCATYIIGNEITLNSSEMEIVSFLNNRDIKNKKDFYNAVFIELEKFEDNFSTYIKKQQNDPKYIKNCSTMFNFLLSFSWEDGNPFGHPISVDTFNYTTPKFFEEGQPFGKVKLRHVNGKIGDAIFGIDANGVSIDDPRYIFTKTYRKMMSLVNGKREDFERKFDNVVVFGHSLSEADYSYFYPLLDALNLYQYHAFQKRFVVAFADYSPSARNDTAWSLIKLIDSYDHWKNPDSNRHGLLEFLETSDRIGFAKIDISELV